MTLSAQKRMMMLMRNMIIVMMLMAMMDSLQLISLEILDTVVKSGTKRLAGKRKVAVKVRKT